jgi:hypothetical protein
MPATYDEPLDTTRYPPVEFQVTKAANSTWRIEYPFADMGMNDYFLIFNPDKKQVNLIRNNARYFTESKQPWARFTVRPRDKSRTVYVCRRITN